MWEIIIIWFKFIKKYYKINRINYFIRGCSHKWDKGISFYWYVQEPSSTSPFLFLMRKWIFIVNRFFYVRWYWCLIYLVVMLRNCYFNRYIGQQNVGNKLTRHIITHKPRIQCITQIIQFKEHQIINSQLYYINKTIISSCSHVKMKLHNPT